MVYIDDYGYQQSPRHLPLPMPSLEELAGEVDREPDRDIIAAVHAAVSARNAPI